MTTFHSYHRAPYPAISPLSPSRSQDGRTVLIAGGSTGIGFNISRGFVAASAQRIILLGRREQQLKEARATLLGEGKQNLEVLTEICDMASESEVAAMWESLRERGVDVHVLVLNAAALPAPIESLAKDLAEVRRMYEFNLFANLRMAGAFLEQGPEMGKAIIHVSSFVVHFSPSSHRNRALALSKGAFTTMLQNIADEMPPERTQIINIHPGTYFTDAAVNMDLGKNTFLWDENDLAGHFAVWAASKEASFLHGRFVWAHWDVDEIREKCAEANDPGFLRMGLQGIKPVGYKDVLGKLRVEDSQ